MDPNHQDYTIVVDDPPVDAYDPDEWHHYFKEFGKIAAVSIIVDNGDLLQRLANNRMYKLVIDHMDNKEYRPDMGATMRGVMNMLGAGKDKIYFLEQYQRNKLELQMYLKQQYQVHKE